MWSNRCTWPRHHALALLRTDIPDAVPAAPTPGGNRTARPAAAPRGGGTGCRRRRRPGGRGGLAVRPRPRWHGQHRRLGLGCAAGRCARGGGVRWPGRMGVAARSGANGPRPAGRRPVANTAGRDQAAVPGAGRPRVGPCAPLRQRCRLAAGRRGPLRPPVRGPWQRGLRRRHGRVAAPDRAHAARGRSHHPLCRVADGGVPGPGRCHRRARRGRAHPRAHRADGSALWRRRPGPRAAGHGQRGRGAPASGTPEPAVAARRCPGRRAGGAAVGRQLCARGAGRLCPVAPQRLAQRPPRAALRPRPGPPCAVTGAARRRSP